MSRSSPDLVVAAPPAGLVLAEAGHEDDDPVTGMGEGPLDLLRSRLEVLPQRPEGERRAVGLGLLLEAGTTEGTGGDRQRHPAQADQAEAEPGSRTEQVDAGRDPAAGQVGQRLGGTDRIGVVGEPPVLAGGKGDGVLVVMERHEPHSVDHVALRRGWGHRESVRGRSPPGKRPRSRVGDVTREIRRPSSRRPWSRRPRRPRQPRRPPARRLPRPRPRARRCCRRDAGSSARPRCRWRP